MHNFLFCNICITLDAPTCFEQYYAHLQEVKIVFYSICYVTLCERPCSELVESGLIGSSVYLSVRSQPVHCTAAHRVTYQML
jgi:hypothetical protein